MKIEDTLLRHPLTTPLDELVKEQCNVRKNEATDVKAKELCRMTMAQLQAYAHFNGYFLRHRSFVENR